MDNYLQFILILFMTTISVSTVQSFPVVSISLNSLEFCRKGRNLHQCYSHRAMDQCRRLSISGVSVSSTGFWTIFKIPGQGYWPIQITHSTMDDVTLTTTPESLTILQLLAGIDMAGTILPPETLAKLVVLHAEENPESLYSKEITAHFNNSVKSSSLLANDSQRNSFRWPRVSLDELALYPTLRMDVSISGIGSLSFTPSSRAIQAVQWNHDSVSTSNFLPIALALRYHSPIILHKIPTTVLRSLKEHFPLYSSIQKLHRTSTSVTLLEQSFQLEKLRGALKIALQKGDIVAERKIRSKIYELGGKESEENADS
jgi:hypothetical protein